MARNAMGKDSSSREEYVFINPNRSCYKMLGKGTFVPLAGGTYPLVRWLELFVKGMQWEKSL